MFKGIYNEIGTGFLQNSLKSSRSAHYKILKERYNKGNTQLFVSKRLMLDGLIFTSYTTLYTIGTWNKFKTEQYKWKPQSEQTVDLKIKKISDTTANVLVSFNKEEVPFQRSYRPVIVKIDKSIKDNSIVEFKITPTEEFEYKDVRTDKTSPNALATVLNVINSYKNPVIIKDLFYFFNQGYKGSIQKMLEYSSKDKLLNCIALNGKLSFINSDQAKLLKEMIQTIDPKTENEVEWRLGIIGKNFNPQISRDEFIAYLKVVRSLNFTENIEDYVDLYTDNEEGKIRTRHQFSKDFQKYIPLDSINKQRISNVDITMKTVAGFDVRFSRSLEKASDIYNLSGEGQRKYRMTYTHPSNMYRLDFTAITDVIFEDRMFIQKDNSREIFQIEGELLSKDVVLEDIFKLLLNIFSKR
jgi:Ca2+-binding EF-hand superfamily protein